MVAVAVVVVLTYIVIGLTLVFRVVGLEIVVGRRVVGTLVGRVVGRVVGGPVRRVVTVMVVLERVLVITV